jgi:hypothetical protein
MSRPRAARRTVFAFSVFSAAWAALAGQACAQGSLEYPVKAAFLYKFGSFVSWPPAAFAKPDAPVVVCVLGKDPFGATLDRLVRDATVNGRKVAVRRVSEVDAGSGCHIVYLGAGTTAEALRAVQGAPVLTVSDEAQGGPRGVLHFVVQEGRVRFQADPAAGARQGLQISSRLLNLAVGVSGR